jgi:hypothetical protein
MRVCALLFGAALAIGTATAGADAGQIASVLWPGWLPPEPVIERPAPGVIPGDPLIIPSWAPNPIPMVSVIRPMDVRVSPAQPRPFEEVFVTISGRTSDPYLTLDTAVVNRQGDDIIIDLQWSTYTPPTLTEVGALQFHSTGYGVERIRPTVSGMSPTESYEVTRSIGTFDVGMYRIHVYSHGALEGEAQASFVVREVAPTLFDLLQAGSW